jgi:3-hydroxyacyl-[acyl-carrier-protein] dehydratase
LTTPDPKVLAAIPHRPPFLWVDSIEEQTDERIVTKKWVDPESEFFKGHYPDFPITPGVLICEAIFQTGAILLSARAKDDLADGLMPVMTKIKDTRFRTMVRPGDTLEIEVTLEDSISKLFHLKGKARVGGKVAVSTSFSVALAPKGD